MMLRALQSCWDLPCGQHPGSRIHHQAASVGEVPPIRDRRPAHPPANVDDWVDVRFMHRVCT